MHRNDTTSLFDDLAGAGELAAGATQWQGDRRGRGGGTVQEPEERLQRALFAATFKLETAERRRFTIGGDHA
jgi:hypothetical protein